jgi:hypothetical protein
MLTYAMLTHADVSAGGPAATVALSLMLTDAILTYADVCYADAC